MAMATDEPPPGLFRMINGCPRILPAALVKGLAQMSTDPPAGYPIHKEIGFLGYFSWPKAEPGPPFRIETIPMLAMAQNTILFRFPICIPLVSFHSLFN